MTTQDDIIAAEDATGWRGSREGWLTAARAALVDRGVGAVKIQPLAAELGLSRTSFYWFFKDRAALLDALLEDWEAETTRVLDGAAQSYAETVQEAVMNVTATFLSGRFASGYDFAIRGWAHQSADVAARVQAADEARLTAIRRIFDRFGFPAGEADVRARAMYLVQIGYISMQVVEDLDTRLARIPAYVTTFTGHPPTDSEMARFRASVTGG